MTDNKKLLDEVRNHGEFENRGWMIETIDRLADALEAAEKAHAPTDDEREALARITSETGDPQDTTLADEILAAGFRRSEPQGEPSDAPMPSDEELTEIESRVYDQYRDKIAGMAAALIREGWVAALRAAGGVR